MVIRTYFWNDRVYSRTKIWLRRHFQRKQWHDFCVGNVGDIFASNLIRFFYSEDYVNIETEGRRLLCIGSIAHKAKPGDVICGVGVKDVPAVVTDATVVGLRGPLSYDRFRDAGYDLAHVRFLADPGLWIGAICGRVAHRPPCGKIFIPHYRERQRYFVRPPRGVRMVDVDTRPEHIARKILEAELVFSSSLHGVIFAHALGRPCVWVAPQTKEPMLKFHDYFLSVGLGQPRPADNIDDALKAPTPVSPVAVGNQLRSVTFPSMNTLQQLGIAV
jgi:hypothetical protein